MRLLLLLLCLHPALLSAAPRVVTSIAPLQEIAAALMHGVGEPGVIIDEHASAHHFAFRPSQMARLQRAELVIWIDRGFEAGFARIPEILPQSVTALEILPALGRAGGDGHIWYAPSLILQSADLIATALVRLDPGHEPQYRENAQAFKAAVESWRQRFAERWQTDAPALLTVHDFLGPFVDDFGLFAIEAIYDRHDAQGGLKDLRRLETQLREAPPACMLTLEPEVPALATSLADKYRLGIVRVMPAGGDSPERALLRRLEGLEDALERCAAGG